MRRVSLLGLRILLELKNGGLKLELMSTALRGSGGRDLVTVPRKVMADFTEADRTFAWWLVAKLHEAEGFANESLVDPYGYAAFSLRHRLTELGKRGKRVKNIEKWTGNMKEWTKIAMDATKVNIKLEGSPVFVPDGADPAVRINEVSPSNCFTDDTNEDVLTRRRSETKTSPMWMCTTVLAEQRRSLVRG